MAYSGILFPALGFIDVYPFRYSFVADHFQYHAMVILIAAIAILLRKLRTRHLQIVVITLLIPLAVKTWRYGHTYHNEETLWRATIDTNPKAWIAHNNLGIIQLRDGNVPDAEQSFSTTINLSPTHGNAWTNLGIALDMQDRPTDANDAFEQAKRLLPDRPDMWRIVAQFHSRRNRHEEALAAWREVIIRTPGDAKAVQSAAETLRKLGHEAQASELLKQYKAGK